jgi:hypothetical protein
MNKNAGTPRDAADKLVRGIKRKTRKHHSAEEHRRAVSPWPVLGVEFGLRHSQTLRKPSVPLKRYCSDKPPSGVGGFGTRSP